MCRTRLTKRPSMGTKRLHKSREAPVRSGELGEGSITADPRAKISLIYPLDSGLMPWITREKVHASFIDKCPLDTECTAFILSFMSMKSLF